MSAANVIEIKKKRSAVEIHEEAKRVCKNIKGDFVALFEILLDVEAHQIYHQFDLASLHVYCVEMLELSPQLAKDFIVVTRKALQVPALCEAIRSKKVTVPKARKICPVITNQNSDEWIALASECTFRVTEKTVALAKPDVLKTESLTFVSADHLKLNLSVSEEWSEFLQRTKDLLAQEKQKFLGTEDALLVLMKDYCMKNDPVEKAKRAEAKAKAKTKKMNNSTKESNEWLACAQPREISRYRRRSVEHAVTLRDQNQCTYVSRNGQRCEERKWLHKHHIVEFALGGEHSLENLKTLCFAHHKMLHKREGVT
jgi:hypothetical protein